MTRYGSPHNHASPELNAIPEYSTSSSFPAISSTSLQPYIKAGLAAEASDVGIVFQLEWGTKKIDAFLRRLFPALFDYFNTTTPELETIAIGPDTSGMKRIEYSLPYVLLPKGLQKVQCRR